MALQGDPAGDNASPRSARVSPDRRRWRPTGLPPCDRARVFPGERWCRKCRSTDRALAAHATEKTVVAHGNLVRERIDRGSDSPSPVDCCGTSAAEAGAARRRTPATRPHGELLGSNEKRPPRGAMTSRARRWPPTIGQKAAASPLDGRVRPAGDAAGSKAKRPARRPGTAPAGPNIPLTRGNVCARTAAAGDRLPWAKWTVAGGDTCS